MKLTVVDASVAIKWFVCDEEGTEAANRLLARIGQQPRHFAVPELFFNEMLSVFCRLSREISWIEKNLGFLESLGLYRVGNGSELLREAARISLSYGLTGYDAVYAATASTLSGTWLTADDKAHSRLSGEGISQMLE